MPPQENQKPNQDQFAQIATRLKEATNVLVTVKASPSVDQLAACIGLTIALNKLGKHATAVFSGEVPSTIEFLEPEKTLEKNTNSLRDFIISLDKGKADKLRYKVEDDVVKIFITPYRTSISEDDLDFSQGDFNVDVVITLGVHDRNELDQVIVAHGRILHDATVISVNTTNGAELGSINWLDEQSSSLSEMMSDLVGAFGDNLMDQQIATAFLTGVVAETDRFRNEKSSPHTMAVSGTLMAAGASTQLVASKLEEPVEPSKEIPEVAENDGKTDDGTIEIDHGNNSHKEDSHNDDSDEFNKVDEILDLEEVSRGSEDRPSEISSMILEPPRLSNGPLTAASIPESQQYSESVDPLSTTNTVVGPTLNHDPLELDDTKTLSEIEQSVNSPHATESAAQDRSYLNPEDITPPPASNGSETPIDPLAPPPPSAEVPPPPPQDHAREAVERAVNASDGYAPEPLQSMGSTPLGLEFHENDGKTDEPQSDGPPPPPVPPPLPPQL
jgi:hypothetical protein